jgi:filamin
MMYTHEAGLGRLSVSMEGPSKSDINIDDLKDGTCEVSYTCTEPGDYLLSIKFDDVHISNSPFKVYVAPSASRKQLQTVHCQSLGCQVNKPASFSVDISADRDQLDAYVIAPSGAECNTIIQELDTDRYCVRFIPRENGVHLVHVLHNKQHITGSPFHLVVGSQQADPSLVQASGSGLVSGTAGAVGKFSVDTMKAGDAALAVTVDGPSKVQLDCCEVTCGYEFQYTPLSAGQYTVSIKYAGESHVPGSPFHVNVKGLSTIAVDTVTKSTTHVVHSQPSRVKSRGKGLEAAMVDNESSFTVDTSASGHGMLLVGVLGPSGPCKQVLVRHVTGSQYNVLYTPSEIGQHIIVVKWADEHIPGSPFHISVH